MYKPPSGIPILLDTWPAVQIHAYRKPRRPEGAECGNGNLCAGQSSVTNILIFSAISIIFAAMKTFLKILTVFIAVGAVGGAVIVLGLAETIASFYCIKH